MTYMKHYYKPVENPGGLAKTMLGKYEALVKCTRCGLIAKQGAGTKFWVNGKFVTKRPPCEPSK